MRRLALSFLRQGFQAKNQDIIMDFFRHKFPKTDSRKKGYNPGDETNVAVLLLFKTSVISFLDFARKRANRSVNLHQLFSF